MAHTGTMDLGRNVQAKPSGNPWQVVGLAIAAIATVAAVWFAGNAAQLGQQAVAKPQAVAVPALADHRYDAIEAQRAAIASTGDCRAISSTTGFTLNVGCPAFSVASGLLSGKTADDIALGRTNGYDAIEAQRGLFAGSLPVCHGVSPTSGLAYSFACSTAAGVPLISSVATTPSGAQYGVARLVYSLPIVPMVQPALEAKAAMVLALAKAEAQDYVARLPYLVATAPSSTSGTFHVGNPAIGDPIAPLSGLKTIDNPIKRDRVGGP